MVVVVADLHGEPGASGSPLLDTDDAVMGIVSRASKTKHLVHSVGFRELAALLAETKDEPLKPMPKLSIFDVN